MSELCAERVEFLLVGAYALAAHGYPRATGDIDIWIRRSEQNVECVMKALGNFGAPLMGLTKEDLLNPQVVFQIGMAPRRIDIINMIDGVEFDDAWLERKEIEIEGLKIYVISRHHLLQNKKASGRPKDQGDISWLENPDDD